jgi:hypothetical protein
MKDKKPGKQLASHKPENLPRNEPTCSKACSVLHKKSEQKADFWQKVSAGSHGSLLAPAFFEMIQ